MVIKRRTNYGDFALHLRLLSLVENTDMAVYIIYVYVYRHTFIYMYMSNIISKGLYFENKILLRKGKEDIQIQDK